MGSFTIHQHDTVRRLRAARQIARWLYDMALRPGQVTVRYERGLSYFGSHDAQDNATATITIEINGGARDDEYPFPSPRPRR